MNYISLRELRGLVERTKGRKLPTAKALRESGAEVVACAEIGADAALGRFYVRRQYLLRRLDDRHCVLLTPVCILDPLASFIAALDSSALSNPPLSIVSVHGSTSLVQ